MKRFDDYTKFAGASLAHNDDSIRIPPGRVGNGPISAITSNMAQKVELIATILKELVIAQKTELQPPQPGIVSGFSFPPQLWLGDGRAIAATDKLIAAISEYAGILSDNDQSLKRTLKTQEIGNLLRRAFALTLSEIDLDCLTDDVHEKIKVDVEARFHEALAHNVKRADLTLGCNLLVGEGIYPITIGPVVFEERLQWLENARNVGRVSQNSARRLADEWGRLAAEWEGRRQRKQKTPREDANEKGIRDSIGDYPIVCTVKTNGLSSKFIGEKGLLAARLAITAVSLVWQSPSKALEWMRLQYDGPSFLRHYVVFGDSYGVGSSSSVSGLPSGKSVERGWKETFSDYRDELGQIGEALSAFVNPSIQTSRSKVHDALFLSLWWYHQACRETSDQMAITKFAASMDALAGGHKAKGIVKLICARLGLNPDDVLMKDGRTTTKVIAEIYDAGRSRLIHGTSENYSHDWEETRATAEGVGRLCLLSACRWMARNPQSDDLKAMSKP